MRRTIIALLGMATLACSEPVAPPTPLIGAWSDGYTALIANPAGATLDSPCITAQFAPLRLDDSLRFHSTGTVTRATGLVIAHPGDPFPLNGRLVGTSVVIGADTLSPGTAHQLVCNA